MPRVDFHTHSTFSDGTLDPERLVAYLASRGVRYAALTDHDTTSGSASFRAALARRGLGCIDGVELTTRSSFGELHLLAYSAGPHPPELDMILPQRVAGRWGTSRAGMGRPGIRESATSSRILVPEAVDVIARLRQAGMASYLAHPFTVTRDPGILEKLLDELIPAGLTGIEAIYGAYSGSEQNSLVSLAREHGLSITAGSDLHEPGAPGHQGVMELDEDQWRAFRDSSFGPAVRSQDTTQDYLDVESPSRVLDPHPDPHPDPLPFQEPAWMVDSWRKKKSIRRQSAHPAFSLRVAFPAMAVAALFVISMFVIILPQVRGMLLEHKKVTIRDITQSVASILAEYDRDVRAGVMDLAGAQRNAIMQIRDIRYGPINKDYLWITDTLPRMVMHPYRPDLDGQDLREYKDGQGLPVFVEFVRATAVTGAGYVEYLWQWEDEKGKIVPKLSFVTRFEPWDWVLGTGVYLDDVNAEISALTNKIVIVATSVSAIAALLLAFMIQQSLATERARQSAESALRESHERYRVLVEASREGMAIVMDGAFTFANSALLELTAYPEHEFLLLSVSDILRPFPDGLTESERFLESLTRGNTAASELPQPFACSLAPKTGPRLDVMISVAGFGLGGREGLMLAVREEGGYQATGGLSIGEPPEGGLPTGELPEAAGSATSSDPAVPGADNIGTFSARWSGRAGLLQVNAEALRLFGLANSVDLSRHSFFSLFSVGAEELRKALNAQGVAARFHARVPRQGSSTLTAPHEVLVTAFKVYTTEDSEPRIFGIMEDVSAEIRAEAEARDRAAAKEAARLDSLEAVSRIAIPPAIGSPDISVRDAASEMEHSDVGITLVVDASGRALGSVSERDLSRRVLAVGADPSSPLYRVMTAPLRLIDESASLLMARSAILKSGSDWMAVEASDGSVTRIIRRSELEAFWADDLTSILEEIGRAQSVEILAGIRHSILDKLRSISAAGGKASYIVRLITEAYDMIVGRLVELAKDQFGEPPCPWAFVALGSAGRLEMLPDSDQDNAIIYDQSNGTGEAERSWFMVLGGYLCDSLGTIGIPPCHHGLMARNHEWCAARAEWESRYTRWVSEPEPDRVVNLNALIDIRMVAGDQDLVSSIRAHFRQAVSRTPSFLLHLANGARNLRIPGIPGTDGPDTRSAAKEASGLFPAFARVYAVQAGLHATGTSARLTALANSGALWAETSRDSIEAYEVLLRNRLTMALGETRLPGMTPGASHWPEGRIAEAMTRAALSQAAVLQKRISFDFSGSSS